MTRPPQDPGPHEHDAHHRAGHEHDWDYVDKDVDGPQPIQREGDYADKDVTPAEPTAEREGEYTDSDVGPDDTDPPKGSYVDKQGPP